MAEVDRIKAQFVRDCAVQALRVWLDDPEQLAALIPKFERGYDQLTEKGYGHPWRAQIEADRGHGAAIPEQKAKPPTASEQHRIRERELASEVLHWRKLSQQNPANKTWTENWRRAHEALREHMEAHPKQPNEANQA